MNIVKDLNPNKAPGPPKLIKAAAHSLSLFLSSIFNSCLESRHYPDDLKIARVTVLRKGGSKSAMKNYPSISILSVFNKICKSAETFKLLE